MRVRGGGLGGEAGFSLVEMAVVTLLIAVFLTLGLGALNVQQEGAAASNTQKNLDAIKEAFVNYVRREGRLPCPTTPLNVTPPEGREIGPCNTTTASAFGVLPYLDLGLTREAALDGWGNFYSYRVSVAVDGARDWTVKNPFISSGNPGGITIVPSIGDPPLTPSAVAVVVSHGRNGHGARTTKGTQIGPSVNANEEKNADDAFTYIYRTRTEEFDDYVMYVTDNDLLGPLVKEGSVKWADVVVQEDFERIKNAVVGRAITTLLLTTSSPLDPWGESYSILLGKPDYGTTGVGSAACDTANAFTVLSSGPDRTLLTADDFSLSVTCDELNGLLAKNGKAS